MQTFQISNTWCGEPAQEAISISLELSQSLLVVRIEAPYHRDPAPNSPPGRLWELWEHEVVEVYLAGPRTSYVELEFGPHGHYLALRLEGERNIVDEHLPVVSYDSQIERNRWRAVAQVAHQILPEGPHRFNAYAMHGNQPRHRLSLFPLAGREADFHQLSSFRPLEL
jgi:hypothetical protein